MAYSRGGGVSWQRPGSHVINIYRGRAARHAFAQGDLVQPMIGRRALRVVALHAARASQGTAPGHPHKANGRARRCGRGGRSGRPRLRQTTDQIQTGSAREQGWLQLSRPMGRPPRAPHEVLWAPPQGQECGKSARGGRRLAAARHQVHVKAAPRAPPGERAPCITRGTEGDCHARVIGCFHPVHFPPGSHHVRALPPRRRCGATPVLPCHHAAAPRDRGTDRQTPSTSVITASTPHD